jgi:mono/diheme cytochrome c family protein
MILDRRLSIIPLAVLAWTALAAEPELPDGSAMQSDLPTTAEDSGSLATGRYLVTIAGCNDCHTSGWTRSSGTTPESDWLTGDSLGWRGPWGTTYPINLRLYVTEMSEDQWVERAHTARTRPPMPWWALHAMSDSDLRSMYRFIRSLGPKGHHVPTYVPPAQEPTTPYLSLEPQMPRAVP